MSKVVSLDDYRPHLVIVDFGGNPHVIPVDFFQKVVDGKRSIDELEQRDRVLLPIISEWLDKVMGEVGT